MVPIDHRELVQKVEWSGVCVAIGQKGFCVALPKGKLSNLYLKFRNSQELHDVANEF